MGSRLEPICHALKKAAGFGKLLRGNPKKKFCFSRCPYVIAGDGFGFLLVEAVFSFLIAVNQNADFSSYFPGQRVADSHDTTFHSSIC